MRAGLPGGPIRRLALIGGADRGANVT